MSENNEEYDLEGGIDDSFFDDIDDFNLEKSESDDRNPISRAFRSFKVQIFKDAKDPSVISDVISDALPQAVDGGDEGDIKTIVKGALEEVGKENKGDILQLTETLKKTIPPGMMERHLNSFDSYYKDKFQDELSPDGDGEEKDDIQVTLDNIFSIQDRINNENIIRQEAGRAMDSNTSKVQFQETLSINSKTLKGIDELNIFNRNITFKYQKSNLETNLRSYAVLRSLLKIGMEYGESSNANLEALVKNTALPEETKLNYIERMSGSLSADSAEELTRGLAGGKGVLSGWVGSKLHDKIVNGLGGALSKATSAQNTYNDLKEMDKADLVGSVAASALFGQGVDYLKYKIGQTMEKHSTDAGNERKEKFMNKINELVETKDEKIQNFKAKLQQDQDDDKGNYITKMVRDLVIEALPDEKDDLVRVTEIKQIKADEVLFKTRTKVVPALLGKILGEVRAIRTGGEPSPIEYDYREDRFVKMKSMNERMLHVTDKLRETNGSEQVEEVINTIDPEGRLSKRDRDKFSKLINENNLDEMLKNNPIKKSISSLTDNDRFKELDSALQYRLKTMISLADTNEMREKMLEMKSSVISPTELLERYIKSGGYGDLVTAGILEYSDDDIILNKEKYRDYTMMNMDDAERQAQRTVSSPSRRSRETEQTTNESTVNGIMGNWGSLSPRVRNTNFTYDRNRVSTARMVNDVNEGVGPAVNIVSNAIDLENENNEASNGTGSVTAPRTVVTNSDSSGSISLTDMANGINQLRNRGNTRANQENVDTGTTTNPQATPRRRGRISLSAMANGGDTNPQATPRRRGRISLSEMTNNNSTTTTLGIGGEDTPTVTPRRRSRISLSAMTNGNSSVESSQNTTPRRRRGRISLSNMANGENNNTQTAPRRRGRISLSEMTNNNSNTESSQNTTPRRRGRISLSDAVSEQNSNKRISLRERANNLTTSSASAIAKAAGIVESLNNVSKEHNESKDVGSSAVEDELKMLKERLEAIKRNNGDLNNESAKLEDELNGNQEARELFGRRNIRRSDIHVKNLQNQEETNDLLRGMAEDISKANKKNKFNDSDGDGLRDNGFMDKAKKAGSMIKTGVKVAGAVLGGLKGAAKLALGAGRLLASPIGAIAATALAANYVSNKIKSAIPEAVEYVKDEYLSDSIRKVNSKSSIATLMEEHIRIGTMDHILNPYTPDLGFSPKINDIDRLRFMQYGITDTDKWPELKKFENMLIEDGYYIKKLGTVETDTTKFPIIKVMDMFNIDPKDKEHKKSFIMWFEKRVKIILNDYMLMMMKLSGSSDLNKYVDLVMRKQKEFVRAVTLFDSFQDISYNPYDATIPLSNTTGMIDAFRTEILRKITELPDTSEEGFFSKLKSSFTKLYKSDEENVFGDIPEVKRRSVGNRARLQPKARPIVKAGLSSTPPDELNTDDTPKPKVNMTTNPESKPVVKKEKVASAPSGGRILSKYGTSGVSIKDKKVLKRPTKKELISKRGNEVDSGPGTKKSAKVSKGKKGSKGKKSYHSSVADEFGPAVVSHNTVVPFNRKHYSGQRSAIKGVKGLVPQVQSNLNGLAKDYVAMTGKRLRLNSTFRTTAEQRELYRLYKAGKGNPAAPPGGSLHEIGYAIDMNTAIMNDINRKGLMKKWGFTRPLKHESWHMEPILVSKSHRAAKRNKKLGNRLAKESLGIGGDVISKFSRSQKRRVSLTKTVKKRKRALATLIEKREEARKEKERKRIEKARLAAEKKKREAAKKAKEMRGGRNTPKVPTVVGGGEMPPLKKPVKPARGTGRGSVGSTGNLSTPNVDKIAVSKSSVIRNDADSPMLASASNATIPNSSVEINDENLELAKTQVGSTQNMEKILMEISGKLDGDRNINVSVDNSGGPKLPPKIDVASKAPIDNFDASTPRYN